MRIILFKLGHLFFGLYFGYPVCCVARFVIDAEADSQQALDRGTCLNGPNSRFVPCGVFHQADEPFVVKQAA